MEKHKRNGNYNPDDIVYKLPNTNEIVIVTITDKNDSLFELEHHETEREPGKYIGWVKRKSQRLYTKKVLEFPSPKKFWPNLQVMESRAPYLCIHLTEHTPIFCRLHQWSYRQIQVKILAPPLFIRSDCRSSRLIWLHDSEVDTYEEISEEDLPHLKPQIKYQLLQTLQAARKNLAWSLTHHFYTTFPLHKLVAFCCSSRDLHAQIKKALKKLSDFAGVPPEELTDDIIFRACNRPKLRKVDHFATDPGSEAKQPTYRSRPMIHNPDEKDMVFEMFSKQITAMKTHDSRSMDFLAKLKDNAKKCQLLTSLDYDDAMSQMQEAVWTMQMLTADLEEVAEKFIDFRKLKPVDKPESHQIEGAQTSV